MKPHQFRSPAVSKRRTKSAEQIRRPLRALPDCRGRAVPQPFHLGWAAARASSAVSYSPVLCPRLSASAYNTRAASSELKEKPDSLAEVTPRPEVSEWIPIPALCSCVGASRAWNARVCLTWGWAAHRSLKEKLFPLTFWVGLGFFLLFIMCLSLKISLSSLLLRVWLSTNTTDREGHT